MPIKKIILMLCFLGGCTGIQAPSEFVYREVKTADFTIATWQKTGRADQPFKFYIEGDGHAFLRNGRPSANPTPKGTLVRALAFGDSSENVIYLARPCQYVQDGICAPRHWTTARFAPEIVRAEQAVIRQIAGTAPVILVGFSGGAEIAGLVAVSSPDLDIRQIVTIAGNLDHRAWTSYHHLQPLNESMNLADYREAFFKFRQVHYVGAKDKVIPPELTKDFVGTQAPIVTLERADHQSGWEEVYPLIRGL